MKPLLFSLAICLGLVGGFLGTDALYLDARADGVTTVDAGAASVEPVAEPPPVVVAVVPDPVPAPAPVVLAQEHPQPQVVRLLEILIDVLSGAVALVLIAVGLAVKKWFSAKTGIDLGVDVDRVAGLAVGYGEEKAHQALKAHGARLTGPEKMEHALKFGLDEAVANRWPEQAKAKLEAIVTAKLGTTRPPEPVPLPVDPDVLT
jgi:hypothetical protein